MNQAELAELQRICAGAVGGPSARLMKRSEAEPSGELVRFVGSPVPSNEGTVGLRIGDRVTVHVSVDDVLDLEREADSMRFKLAVSADTFIALTTTQMSRARSELPHRSEALGDDPDEHNAAPIPRAAASRFVAPWFRSSQWWSCAGNAAQTCDGRYGPLYDDGGFMNGELVDCYVAGGESCDELERALPPDR